MTERGWGRVQNIASDSAVVIPAEPIHYGMSKTPLLAVSRGFAKQAAGTGVTVNSVIAGPTHTGGVEDFVHQLVGRDLPWDEAQRAFPRQHRPQSLLQRLIEPEEIAHMVVYLASDQASATTGGALRVDGGYVDSILPRAAGSALGDQDHLQRARTVHPLDPVQLDVTGRRRPGDPRQRARRIEAFESLRHGGDHLVRHPYDADVVVGDEGDAATALVG